MKKVLFLVCLGLFLIPYQNFAQSKAKDPQNGKTCTDHGFPTVLSRKGKAAKISFFVYEYQVLDRKTTTTFSDYPQIPILATMVKEDKETGKGCTEKKVNAYYVWEDDILLYTSDAKLLKEASRLEVAQDVIIKNKENGKVLYTVKALTPIQRKGNHLQIPLTKAK